MGGFSRMSKPELLGELKPRVALRRHDVALAQAVTSSVPEHAAKWEALVAQAREAARAAAYAAVGASSSAGAGAAVPEAWALTEAFYARAAAARAQIAAAARAEAAARLAAHKESLRLAGVAQQGVGIGALMGQSATSPAAAGGKGAGRGAPIPGSAGAGSASSDPFDFKMSPPVADAKAQHAAATTPASAAASAPGMHSSLADSSGVLSPEILRLVYGSGGSLERGALHVSETLPLAGAASHERGSQSDTSPSPGEIEGSVAAAIAAAAASVRPALKASLQQHPISALTSAPVSAAAAAVAEGASMVTAAIQQQQQQQHGKPQGRSLGGGAVSPLLSLAMSTGGSVSPAAAGGCDVSPTAGGTSASAAAAAQSTPESDALALPVTSPAGPNGGTSASATAGGGSAVMSLIVTGEPADTPADSAAAPPPSAAKAVPQPLIARPSGLPSRPTTAAVPVGAVGRRRRQELLLAAAGAGDMPSIRSAAGGAASGGNGGSSAPNSMPPPPRTAAKPRLAALGLAGTPGAAPTAMTSIGGLSVAPSERARAMHAERIVAMQRSAPGRKLNPAAIALMSQPGGLEAAARRNAEAVAAINAQRAAAARAAAAAASVSKASAFGARPGASAGQASAGVPLSAIVDRGLNQATRGRSGSVVALASVPSGGASGASGSAGGFGPTSELGAPPSSGLATPSEPVNGGGSAFTAARALDFSAVALSAASSVAATPVHGAPESGAPSAAELTRCLAGSALGIASSGASHSVNQPFPVPRLQSDSASSESGSEYAASFINDRAASTSGWASAPASGAFAAPLMAPANDYSTDAGEEADVSMAGGAMASEVASAEPAAVSGAKRAREAADAAFLTPSAPVSTAAASSAPLATPVVQPRSATKRPRLASDAGFSFPAAGSAPLPAAGRNADAQVTPAGKGGVPRPARAPGSARAPSSAVEELLQSVGKSSAAGGGAGGGSARVVPRSGRGLLPFVPTLPSFRTSAVAVLATPVQSAAPRNGAPPSSSSLRVSAAVRDLARAEQALLQATAQLQRAGGAGFVEMLQLRYTRLRPVLMSARNAIPPTHKAGAELYARLLKSYRQAKEQLARLGALPSDGAQQLQAPVDIDVGTRLPIMAPVAAV